MPTDRSHSPAKASAFPSIPEHPSALPESIGEDERRTMHRHQMNLNAVVMPIHADSSPTAGDWLTATTIDISAGGAGLALQQALTTPIDRLMVGIASKTGGRVYATMNVESNSTTSDGNTQLHAAWTAGSDDDLLLATNLRPYVSPQTLSFEHRFTDEVMHAWADLGVLRRYLVDRVLLCARCGAMPSWRNGCRVCGSGRVHNEQLIHHFDCGHIDHVNAFGSADEQQCPKCHSTDLMGGAGYDLVNGDLECFDCGTKGGTASMSAMCHCCHHRFSLQEAEERPLYAYHVDRLDPISIVANA